MSFLHFKLGELETYRLGRLKPLFIGKKGDIWFFPFLLLKYRFYGFGFYTEITTKNKLQRAHKLINSLKTRTVMSRTDKTRAASIALNLDH